LRFTRGKTRDRSSLIMVLNVDCIPTIVDVHENLLFRDNRFQLPQIPFSLCEFIIGSVI
jgi:hypothetical protein